MSPTPSRHRRALARPRTPTLTLAFTLALACGPDTTSTSDANMSSESSSESSTPGTSDSDQTSGNTSTSGTSSPVNTGGSTGATSSTDATSSTGAPATSSSTGAPMTSGSTTSGTDPGTTSTGLGTSSTGLGTSSTGDCNFICDTDTDGGGNIECDIWAQDCPEGEKCAPTGEQGGAYDSTKCVPIDDNPAQSGDTCGVQDHPVSGEDSCDLGLLCWDVDPDSLEGVCVDMCQGSPDNPVCSEPETACLIANDGVLILCLDTCDPLAQNCPDEQGCLFFNNNFQCVPLADDIPNGDECEFVNVCVEGSACIGAESFPGCGGLGCCSPFCEVDAPVVCPAPGMECVPWFEQGEAPPGYEDVGVCALPP